MNRNFKQLNAFTLAEGGRSPLLYGDEGVAEGYSCVETKGGHSPLLSGDEGTQGSPRLVKRGFTLAEVLITLGVIGVVAAVTMPTLIKNYQKKQTVTQLKKAYSELSQAISMAQRDFGSYEDWNFGPFASSFDATQHFFNNIIKPNLKIKKSCIPTSEECWALHTYTLNGQEADCTSVVSTVRSSFMTTSGYSVFFWLGSSGTNGWIFIDINGPKKPNTLGKDTFVFSYGNSSFIKHGLFPYGSYSGEILSRDTIINGTAPLIGGCNKIATSSRFTGYTCAQLIIMDNWEIKDDYPW